MLINKYCLVEKACYQGYDRPALHNPRLDLSDPKLPVVLSSDGIILASIPVQVEHGDTAGTIPAEALKASRKCPKSCDVGFAIHPKNEDTVIVKADSFFRPSDAGANVGFKEIIDGAASVRKNSKTIKIALNAAALAYLAKALGSDHVSLEIGDALQPVLVRPLGLWPRQSHPRCAKIPHAPSTGGRSLRSHLHRQTPLSMNIDNYPKANLPIGVWISSAPTISTCHLPKECWEDVQDAAVMANDDGCLLHLEDNTEPERYARIPLAAAEIATCDRFLALGYTHVRFDPDGDVIEGLPTYTW